MSIGVLSRFTAVAVALIATGQPQPSAKVSYVASIRPNVSADARTLSEYSPGGRFTATAITLGSLVRLAYRTADYRIVGAPDWFSTARYDISAKVESDPPPGLQVFLQTLLADRFHLAVHNQTRELPTFVLVVARGDRRLGSKLTQSDFDCGAYATSRHALPDPTRTPPCATRSRPGMLSGKAISMTQFAATLSSFVRRFTVDKTGLAGVFDVELTWDQDDAAPTGTAAAAGQPDSLAPSLFAALREQLGLKLVADRGPVDVLVIDHAERPTEN